MPSEAEASGTKRGMCPFAAGFLHFGLRPPDGKTKPCGPDVLYSIVKSRYHKTSQRLVPDRNCRAALGHCDMRFRRPVKPSDYIYLWIFMALAFGVWFFYPALKVGRVEWPPIEDPNALLRECADLVKTPGEVKRADWPPSVKRLHPVRVQANQEYVSIRLSGGREGAWGYFVCPDRSESPALPGGLHESVFPGIFKFEMY
jgi:hypothetical protein